MAKNKSSQQVDLASKTGINVTSNLDFVKKPAVPEEVAPIIEETTVDKLVDSKDNNPKPSAKTSQNAKPAPKIDTPVIEAPEKPVSKGKTKLKRPDDPEREDNICKISANISEEAKRNLEKYAKLYGYKKLSPFLNDLLERLDLYMD